MYFYGSTNQMKLSCQIEDTTNYDEFSLPYLVDKCGLNSLLDMVFPKSNVFIYKMEVKISLIPTKTTKKKQNRT